MQMKRLNLLLVIIGTFVSPTSTAVPARGDVPPGFGGPRRIGPVPFGPTSEPEQPRRKPKRKPRHNRRSKHPAKPAVKAAATPRTKPGEQVVKEPGRSVAGKPQPAETVGKRRPATSQTLRTFEGDIVQYNMERNGDYNVVFQDTSGSILIATIPDPKGKNLANPQTAQVASIRREFAAKFKMSLQPQRTRAHARVTASIPSNLARGIEAGAKNTVQIHTLSGLELLEPSGD
jgi:hypothetical protein